MKACVGALAVGGLLVFSITYPCFERLGSSWREHEIAERYGFNFHRPFSAYFNQLARLGCHLREVAEPALDPEIAAAAGPGAEVCVHLPNFLVVAAERSKVNLRDS
jgi:hypothetical protein